MMIVTDYRDLRRGIERTMVMLDQWTVEPSETIMLHGKRGRSVSDIFVLSVIECRTMHSQILEITDLFLEPVP